MSDSVIRGQIRNYCANPTEENARTLARSICRTSSTCAEHESDIKLAIEQFSEDPRRLQKLIRMVKTGANISIVRSYVFYSQV